MHADMLITYQFDTNIVADGSLPQCGTGVPGRRLSRHGNLCVVSWVYNGNRMIHGTEHMQPFCQALSGASIGNAPSRAWVRLHVAIATSQSRLPGWSAVLVSFADSRQQATGGSHLGSIR